MTKPEKLRTLWTDKLCCYGDGRIKVATFYSGGEGLGRGVGASSSFVSGTLILHRRRKLCMCRKVFAVNPLIFMALYSHNPGAATGSSQVLKHGTSAKFVHDAMQKNTGFYINWDCAL